MQIEDGILIRCIAQNRVVAVPDGVEKIGEWAFSDTEDRRLRRDIANIRTESVLEEVIFPASLKTICKGAFHKEDHLQKVHFTEGIEEIADVSFAFCTSLSEVILPDSIRAIHCRAFAGCKALTKAVIPHAVSGCNKAGAIMPNCISDSLFSGCYALQEAVIPMGTTTICEEAFENCQSLTDISIPDSVEEIGDRAFNGCISIRELKFPYSVKRIGREAVPGGEHSKLEKILVSPENEMYCSIDGVLYTKDMSKLIACPVNYAKTSFVVPKGVEEISACAFEGCKKIRKIVLPDSVVQIGEKAFSRMYNLRKVVLPAFLRELSAEAFAYCIKLSDVTWPKGSLQIGKGCFMQTGFRTITLPETVVSIDDYAFASNPFTLVGMVPARRASDRIVPDKVSVPKSVQFLGISAFYGAKEIEVYDTVDPDAKPAEEGIDSINGHFNGLLGSVGIYQSDGYVIGACNSRWHDHVITVRSAIDGSIKHRVRMPDGQKRKVYCTFASAWGKNGEFNFKAIDEMFDELTPTAKLDYAMDRLLNQKGISDQFLNQLKDYIGKRAKRVITTAIETDNTMDLMLLARNGFIKERSLSDHISQASKMGATQCEQWLVAWQADIDHATQ